MMRKYQTSEFVRERRDRRDRMHNIVIGCSRMYAADPSIRTISKLLLREFVRDALGLPQLTGEDWLGDRRAHGDAVGGHGLLLDVGSDKDTIRLSDMNIAKINAYLHNQADHIVLHKPCGKAANLAINIHGLVNELVSCVNDKVV